MSSRSVAGRFPHQSAFKSFGGVFGLADQDEGLPKIVGGQGINWPVGFGVFERGDGGGILAALEFKQSQDEPCRAVVRLLLQPVAIRLDELIK